MMPQPQPGVAPPPQASAGAPPQWGVIPPPMPPQQYAPSPQQPAPPPPQMWGQAPQAAYGQAPPGPQAAYYGDPPGPQAAYYGGPPAPVAAAPPVGPNELRTLWIGDLQYWMDENYVFGCFASTGEFVGLLFCVPSICRYNLSSSFVISRLDSFRVMALLNSQVVLVLKEFFKRTMGQ